MLVIAGKPVVEHIIGHIRESGISDFALVTRYLHEKIEEYFGDGSNFGMKVSYIPQPENYGTGAALLAARGFVDQDDVMLTFGDVITSPESYAGVLDVFKVGDCDAAIALFHIDDPHKGAAVLINEAGDRVERIVEKPKPGERISNWMNAGIFAFQSSIWPYLENLTPSVRGEYELPSAINAMIADGLIVRPYVMRGPWQDVGCPEDLAKAEKILLEGLCLHD